MKAGVIARAERRPARSTRARGAAATLATLATLCVGLAVPLTVTAGAEGAGRDTREPSDGRAWLERMRSAANKGNYEGTLVFSAGGAMSSTRVWHYCVGDQTYERLEAQDGRQQRVFRHNDEVRTVWPQARVAVIERREALAGGSSTPQRVEPRALEHYELRREGEDRVAGRDAAVFLLEPRDGLRYAQRLWADQATGLMLRADVLGPGRAVLETSAFSMVDVNVRPQPETVLQPMRQLEAVAVRLDGKGEAKAEARGDAKAEARADSWRLLRPPLRRTDLEAEGWTLKQTVPGFRLAGCMVRGIESGGQEVNVLQAVFSDGLTHVSLFIEPYRPERHRGEMRAQSGAASTVMRRLGDHWVTAVGDVPAATLKLFTDALERRR